MNLLELMRKEIDSLNLTDKVKIKDYLYKRTGEIFIYDPLWAFAEDQREALRNKRIDIKNVCDLYVTCYSWAYLFRDLLHAFCIPAKVVKLNDHAFVEAFIGGEKYYCDLMLNLEDIKRIKFGMKAIYNFRLSNSRELKEGRVFEDNNSNDTSTDVILEQIKEIFIEKKKSLSDEEFVYQVFIFIKNFVNSYFAKPSIGYVAGVKFIYHLLQYFISEEYYPTNTHFFDTDKGEYIEVFSVPLKGNIVYFAYRSLENGIFKLEQVSKEIIDSFLRNYSSLRTYNLTLQQKPAEDIVKKPTICGAKLNKIYENQANFDE